MSSGGEVQQNLRTVDDLLMDASARGVAIAFLPENLAIIGASDRDKLEHAEDPGSGPIQEFGKCYGASIVYDSDGGASPIYRKMHLFDVDLPGRDERYRESATMDFGDDLVIVPTPLGQLGLSICYDLRFPELYRRLVDDGATVLSIPAAFTATTGKAHWHSLLRARAIENLAYVIAAGQHGSHPGGRKTFGHSVIIGPWGQVIAELEAGDGIVDAEIDPALPGKLRAEFPVLEHRRM
jgi:nitrilase